MRAHMFKGVLTDVVMLAKRGLECVHAGYSDWNVVIDASIAESPFVPF